MYQTTDALMAAVDLLTKLPPGVDHNGLRDHAANFAITNAKCLKVPLCCKRVISAIQMPNREYGNLQLELCILSNILHSHGDSLSFVADCLLHTLQSAHYDDSKHFPFYSVIRNRVRAPENFRNFPVPVSQLLEAIDRVKVHPDEAIFEKISRSVEEVIGSFGRFKSATEGNLRMCHLLSQLYITKSVAKNLPLSQWKDVDGGKAFAVALNDLGNATSNTEMQEVCAQYFGDDFDAVFHELGSLKQIHAEIVKPVSNLASPIAATAEWPFYLECEIWFSNVFDFDNMLIRVDIGSETIFDYPLDAKYGEQIAAQYWRYQANLSLILPAVTAPLSMVITVCTKHTFLSPSEMDQVRPRSPISYTRLNWIRTLYAIRLFLHLKQCMYNLRDLRDREHREIKTYAK